MKLDKLTFHRRWAEILSGLSDAERLEVYDAIVKYGLDFEESTMSTPTAMMAFKMICSDIDTERRHKNSVAKVRSKAGKLGGRPKQPPAKPPEETASDMLPTPEVIEDVEIIEEIPSRTSTVGSTATNLFGEEISPEPIKPKPQRPQKPSKKHYAPEVLMTETEYNTLVSKYGQETADWCITRLDDYKAACGMTYKSDYRAILNWVIKEYYKQHGTTSTDWQPIQPTAKERRDIEFASYIAGKLGGYDAQK
jgi:hypothetical protein